MSTRTRSLTLATVGVGLALALSGCSGGGETSPSGAAAAEDFTLCMGVGGKDAGSMAQGDAAEALAEKNGWKYYELNNNSDGPTANTNVDLFIQHGCSTVMEFNYAGTQEVIQQKLETAGIPGITFDLPQKGMYLVAVDNEGAGKDTGVALGEEAKSMWDCDADLVLLGEQANAGPVNDLRVGGSEDGLLSVCPNIDKSKIVNFEGGNTVDTATTAARDALVSRPEAEKILTLGIGDNTVFAVLQAADQLGRGANTFGWGQGAYLLSGDSTPAGLLGDSVYFFEDYPIAAVDQLVKKIAAGDAPAMADTLEDAAVSISACLTDRQQTLDMPAIDIRLKQLIADGLSSNAYDTFCPSASNG
ncbi:hypothetical protein [Microbacterium pumilum]|uniref:Sugar ABC transporter substrate-binding protein n=1 Tax=Microbacterium pumilum TaxID=344165 RepID=A0ABN2T1N8_9MICO